MEAISEVLTIHNGTIHYTLPDHFKAKRVQLIILPVDDPQEKISDQPNRIHSLRGSIKGKEADALEQHIKEIRNEW
nr:hypothetical protein [uncultured Arsenicibacter sp.]